MKNSETQRLGKLFAALSDATRLRLLNSLSDGEVCVCFLVAMLGQSQPMVSRHLAYLRGAGLVSARRDGKWMHYRLTIPKDSTRAAALQAVLEVLSRDPGMQAERARLRRSCCVPVKKAAPGHVVKNSPVAGQPRA